MNQGTAIQLREYCIKKHLGFPSQSLSASATGKVSCLRAISPGLVEKRGVSDELATIDGLLAEIERDKNLDVNRSREFKEYLTASKRSLKKLERLRAQGLLLKLTAEQRLAALFKRAREAQGLLVSQVAPLLPVGEDVYRQIESGYLNPPDDVLKSISEVLGLNFDQVKAVRDLDKESPVFNLMGIAV